MKEIVLNEKSAIALKYPEGAVAPIIMAKGKGFVAEKIIDEAEKNQIAIEENVPVINMLDENHIGDVIPQEAWEAVSIIFSYILERNEYKNNWK